MIRIIHGSAENARDLTANLLAFSRKQKIISTPVKIQDIIDKTIALAERSIDRKISIKKYYPEPDCLVIGDPSQLQNALLNLILNSRDAMPSGGSISIRAEKTQLGTEWCSASIFNVTPGEYIVIEVRDTGKGISPKIQTRIFEPFFTTKETGKGTGLGLSAVYGTMTNHQGAVLVESTPGKGISFFLYIPLISPPR